MSRSAAAATKAQRATSAEARSERLRAASTRPVPRHRARALLILAAVVVGTSSLAIVAGQAVVASQQVHLDNVRGDLASAVAENENLQLERAQLESPGEILVIAQQKLHMVVPKSVTYLAPSAPGASVGEMQKAAHR